ncbi:Holliday junction branch migration protein RuvA [Desulfobacterales bacterium HSG17]|nr:Holliday junction branch migration protein RuvA [Desulfobacterales bacterium HSG17]
MIGYLEGKIMKKEAERILLLVNHVGYEVMLPGFVMNTLKTKTAGDNLDLYIFHQQTERQPKPVLIGFNSEIEKEFFQHFISVEAIGPLKAVKALTLPMSETAEAIESKKTDILKNLKGIGARTAQKIIATLSGKMDKFAQNQNQNQNQESGKKESHPVFEDVAAQVMLVLVEQLGHKPTEAKTLIAEAFKRNNTITSPEELFDEIYQGTKINSKIN